MPKVNADVEAILDFETKFAKVRLRLASKYKGDWVLGGWVKKLFLYAKKIGLVVV